MTRYLTAAGRLAAAFLWILAAGLCPGAECWRRCGVEKGRSE
ncbi:MAG TPA: hypothetical protein VM243_15160 [Phycisphaerae bacterium]|nr:hypothetical protein [Phycisphaerae bacterium]